MANTHLNSIISTSPLYCGHAKESPSSPQCVCPAECYCRVQGNCENIVVESPIRKSEWNCTDKSYASADSIGASPALVNREPKGGSFEMPSMEYIHPVRNLINPPCIIAGIDEIKEAIESIPQRTMATCGFLFSPDKRQVLLTFRTKEPCKGLWNGLGGKYEEDEYASVDGAIKCMEREFQEETKLHPKTLDNLNWESIVNLRGDEWEVEFFWAVARSFLPEHFFQGLPDIIQWKNVNDILSGRLEVPSNLPWMIALALDDNTQKPLGLGAF